MPPVFISDFDGTMTQKDFYSLAMKRLLAPEHRHYREDFRAGKISHFMALQSLFRHIRAPEEEVLEVLRAMRPDPLLLQGAERLRAAGWSIVVASYGCEWYIQRILASLHVTLEVYANPGRYDPGGPLIMEEPVNSPFHSSETGVDKAAIVRFHQQRGATVAYAGDSLMDLDAALLASPQRRYACNDLAAALTARNEDFRSFSRWADIVPDLLSKE